MHGSVFLPSLPMKRSDRRLDYPGGSLLSYPSGASAQVAILTQHIHDVALIRHTLLRVRSSQNYVFFEGH
jgi:hypothetical protein